jgi:hypothetical protein
MFPVPRQNLIRTEKSVIPLSRLHTKLGQELLDPKAATITARITTMAPAGLKTSVSRRCLVVW